MSREQRGAQVEWEHRELPLSTQADLLSISRASLQQQPRPPSEKAGRINHRIDEIYTDQPFSGSRRITAQLQREGMDIHRKAVQRHRREMGIEAISPGPNLRRRRLKDQVQPSVLRPLRVSYPNHGWGRDSTYLRMQRGWLQLVALLDWYSRYGVSWELDRTLEMPFVVTAVERALTQAVPLLCTSDQGSHFTSPPQREWLLAAHVQISLDGKGRAFDTIFTARVWRSVKQEEVYWHEQTSPKAARSPLQNSFELYHHTRLHQALEYQTPAEVYFQKREEQRF